MSDNTEKLFNALAADPKLMDQLLQAKNEGPTRAMPGADPVSEVLKGILGDDADLSEAADALDANGMMQLFLGANGDIDAKELVDYVGSLSPGEKASSSESVRALLDGKLDFKEILMLIAILKLLKGKKKPAQNTGLLGGLLGANQQPQTSSALDLFSSMLGAQTAAPQTYQNSLFGNLFGTQPVQSQPQVFSFGGSSNTSTGMNVLNSLLTGNTGNNAQAQSVYSLLNGTNNAFNSSGTINVGTLFSLANALLGMRK